jgi:hypothetical protein
MRQTPPLPVGSWIGSGHSHDRNIEKITQEQNIKKEELVFLKSS